MSFTNEVEEMRRGRLGGPADPSSSKVPAISFLFMDECNVLESLGGFGELKIVL